MNLFHKKITNLSYTLGMQTKGFRFFVYYYVSNSLFAENMISLLMSRHMGKPTICICENKLVTAKLISAFVFATRIVHFLFFLNPKFQASSLLLCLYSSVCVRPVRKPHCWFSHEAALIFFLMPLGTPFTSRF